MVDVARSLIKLTRQGQTLARDGPLVVDLVVAMLVGGVSLAELAATDVAAGRAPDLIAVGLIVVGSAVLFWRRRGPILALSGVAAALAVIYLLGYGTFSPALGVAAIYSAAAHGSRRRETWLVVAVVVAGLFAVASISLLDKADGYDVANAIGFVMYCLAAAVAGGIVRNRQEIFLSAQARADHAEATRLAEAERAVARERLRIAREMHDVVAHSMSVISVQAAAAQEITGIDPDRAITVMHNVENTARQALDEMRRMLGVLRSSNDAATGLAPQPTLSDLAAVVAQSNDAGVATELEIAGRPRDLAPGIELAAFRIVQEALTNVRKHAGHSASAVVRIVYEAATLTVEVVDDGAGSASSLAGLGAGNGLIGMRERVDVYDGELSAAPRTGGGYAVTARLPVPVAADVAVRPVAPQETA